MNEKTEAFCVDPKVLFEYMRQFIGAKMKVSESMGQYTASTLDDKVVLSSACRSTDRFYCSPEKLAPHVGHSIVCVGYGQDEIVNISIECEDCNEVLFDVDAPADEPDGEPKRCFRQIRLSPPMEVTMYICVGKRCFRRICLSPPVGLLCIYLKIRCFNL